MTTEHIRIDDYIEMLQRKRAALGNIYVCFTEEGNYSGGTFAEIYTDPEVHTINTTGSYVWCDMARKYVDIIPEKDQFLVLGNSEQWC